MNHSDNDFLYSCCGIFNVKLLNNLESMTSTNWPRFMHIVIDLINSSMTSSIRNMKIGPLCKFAIRFVIIYAIPWLIYEFTTSFSLHYAHCHWHYKLHAPSIHRIQGIMFYKILPTYGSIFNKPRTHISYFSNIYNILYSVKSEALFRFLQTPIAFCLYLLTVRNTVPS